MKRLLSLSFVILSLTSVQSQISIQFTPRVDITLSPVYVSLDKPVPLNRFYTLQIDRSRKRIPVQFTDSLNFVFISPITLHAGRVYHFLLEPSGVTNNSPVRITARPSGLEARISNKPVLFYHTLESRPAADSPAYYQRSGFIHPLYDPFGNILTDDFPAGHAHQHGVFTAWVSTKFRNHAVDFWNQQQQLGTVKHKQVIYITNGPVYSEFRTTLQYVSFQDGPVLEETWTVSIFPYQDYYLLDLLSVQKNITSDTLYLNRYHYGGLAFRGSRQWNPDDKSYFRNSWNILTSEGRKDTAANGTAAKWVDASGIINGKVSGVTIFGHPSNFRFPQYIRVHPYMPYWCFVPVANEPFYIAPGARYCSQYRYFIHKGKANEQQISQLFNEFTAAAKRWGEYESVR